MVQLKKNIKLVVSIGICALTLLLWICACSCANQYVDKDGNNKAQPIEISLLKKSSIKTIVPSEKNTFFVMNNGSLLAVGDNSAGLLGQNDYEEYDYPVEVQLPERIKLVAASGDFAVAVSESNNLYFWGSFPDWAPKPQADEDGNVPFYAMVSSSSIISQICLSNNHCAYLVKEGDVYTLGLNIGQLGYENSQEHYDQVYSAFRVIATADTISYIAVSDTATYMINSLGQIYGASQNDNYELCLQEEAADYALISQEYQFVTATTAGSNLFALTSSGDVYVCGSNANGVLGVNSSAESISQLTRINFDTADISDVQGSKAGTVHFLTTDMDVYACGNNEDGRLYTRDRNEMVLSPSQVRIGKVTRLYCGGTAIYYLDNNRHLYAYGENTYGQMPNVDSQREFVAPERIYASVK